MVLGGRQLAANMIHWTRATRATKTTGATRTTRTTRTATTRTRTTETTTTREDHTWLASGRRSLILPYRRCCMRRQQQQQQNYYQYGNCQIIIYRGYCTPSARLLQQKSNGSSSSSDGLLGSGTSDGGGATTTTTDDDRYGHRLRWIPKWFWILMGWSHLVDPKKQLERRYLCFALMALKVRQLRLYQQQEQEKNNQDISSSSSSTTTCRLSSLSELRLQAIEQLHTEGIDDYSNEQLYRWYGDAVEPQVVQILQTFTNVDAHLNLFPVVDNNNNHNNNKENNNNEELSLPLEGMDVSYLQQILKDEHAHAESELVKLSQQQQQQQQEEQVKTEQGQALVDDQDKLRALLSSRQAFLETKQGALATLLDFHGVSLSSSSSTTTSSATSSLDWFGMDPAIIESNDDETKELIRQYQTLNMCRSALIRQKLGYSILCLRSTLDHSHSVVDGHDNQKDTSAAGATSSSATTTTTTSVAGRGVFVDGHAQMGHVMAFQPGVVWPKEFLVLASSGKIDPTLGTDASRELAHAFASLIGEDDDRNENNDLSNNNNKTLDDDPCMTSLRFDDFLLDARNSPVTVLTQSGSCNPWALGHMVNHPNRDMWPNCQSMSLNYSQRMMTKTTTMMTRYIPNTYIQEPTWKTLSQVMFYNSSIGDYNSNPMLMYGLCLLARRDMNNEELLYDYRLQTEQTPSWYHPVIYNDDVMDKQPVVFFDPSKDRDNNSNI